MQRSVCPGDGNVRGEEGEGVRFTRGWVCSTEAQHILQRVADTKRKAAQLCLIPSLQAGLIKLLLQLLGRGSCCTHPVSQHGLADFTQ